MLGSNMAAKRNGRICGNVNNTLSCGLTPSSSEWFIRSTQEMKRKKGSAKYKTKFQKGWSHKWPYIMPVLGDDYKFECTICNRTVSCSHQGETDVRRHIAQKIHGENFRRFQSRQQACEQNNSSLGSATDTDETEKFWEGRFSSKLDPVMEKFNASIGFDKRLWDADLKGSQAYVKALKKVGIVTDEEYQQIYEALGKIREEWAKGKFLIKESDEDIHTANERRLKELASNHIGGKLHTGRSRNDQVSTDMRLWLREEIKILKLLLLELIRVLVKRSEKEIHILMPGYTHLQRAQPIRWSHWLLSYAWFFRQDVERLENLYTRVNVLPLGSGAIAGNPFNIDREFLAKELEFCGCTQNSMQGVSDRDFIAEFMFWASLTSVHLSKLAEDLILYSSKEFGFVALSEAYCTGSSLMPQKKNADGLELIRGKTGRIFGHCTGLLVVLKGLPSTFNKDLQEDKEAMFDTYDTMHGMLQISIGIMQTLSVSSDACAAALSPDMLATDIAYYLVRKGVAFRDAHKIAGQTIALAEKKSCGVSELSLTDLEKISDLFAEDISQIWDYENSVEQYKCTGGTSKASVISQIQFLSHWLAGIDVSK